VSSNYKLGGISVFRKYSVIVGIMIIVAVALRLWGGIPTGATLAVLLIGWPLVGTLITIDDDLPGGWSNPDGKAVPEWKTLWWWADIVLVRGGLVFMALFVEETAAGHRPFKLLAAALVMLAVGLPLFTRGVKKEMTRANAA
jgi:hypothetical protein